jgi:ATP-binding cassette, subfamily B, bacterial MsbA
MNEVSQHVDNDDQVHDPDPKQTQSLLRRLLTENLASQWRLYVIAVISMVIVAAMTAATAFLMKNIVDTMTAPDSPSSVYMVSASVALVFIVKGIATYIQTVTMNRAGMAVVVALQRSLYDRLLQQGMAFFNASNSSNLVLRITQGANAARGVIDLIVSSYVRDVLSVIFLVGVMIYQQPFLSIFAIMVGPFALLGVKVLLAKTRAIASQEQSSLGEIIRVMQETATGVRVIKAFGLEAKMQDRMNAAIAVVEKRSIALTNISAITSPMMDTLSGLAIAGVVSLSAVGFMGLQNSTPGSLISFITALLMAYEPAKRLTRLQLQMARSMQAVSAMFAIIDKPDAMPNHPEAVDLPSLAGNIVFDDVSFAFTGRKTVLESISQDFEAGKTTALVGPSGGGKSTIINLAMRMYDPSAGRVLIGGIDLKMATVSSLREKIALVSQDTFLFATTVMENIRVGREDATDDEVIEAAKLANAHDFILEMPKGYQTLVGENGNALSGGQKQRVSIARALLRQAPILLMDEATSALDAISEAAIRDALETVSAGRTTIIIAHRLSTILNADLICYVEDGNIIEKGHLQELLDKNGHFAKLYHEQFS